MQSVSSAVSTALSSGTVYMQLLAESAPLCVPTAVPLYDSTGAPLFVLVSGPLPEGRVDGDGILSLSYHAACCDGDIGIGNVLSASISVRLKGVFPLLGTVIRAQYGVEVGGSVEWLNLGRFTVTNCTRTDHETQFAAYDAAYTLSGQYVPTVQSGSTVYNVLADVCSQAGLEAEQTTLNYGLQITVTGTLTGHSLREMLGYLAGLCGRNCVISRDGFVRFVWFEASGASIGADDYYSGTLSNGGVSTFAGLRCTVPAAQEGQEGTVLTVGDADRAVEYSNPFMSQARLDAIWSAVGGYEYPAGEVSFYRGVLTEPGDVVALTNLAGVTIQLPAMQVELTFDGGGRSTVRSFGRGDTVRACDSVGPREQRLQRVAGTAGAALLSANGKNKNFYQASAPTTADGLTPGDLWFDTANGNRVSEWTGSAWTLRPFGALAVTNLDAGSITAGTLNVDRIGANSITANKINVSDLFAQDITATGIIRGARFTTGGKFSVDAYGSLTSEDGTFSKCSMQNGYVDTCLCEDLRWFVEYWGNPPPEGEAEDPDTPRRYDRRIYRLSADSNGYAIGAAVLPSWYSDQLTPQVVPDPNELWEEASNRMTLARFWADSNGTGWVDVNGLNVSGNAAVGGSLSLANNTWNTVGDDAQIGDVNAAGLIGIRGLNGATGIRFVPNVGNTNNVAIDLWSDGAGILSVNGNFNIAGTLKRYGRDYIHMDGYMFAASCSGNTWSNQNHSVWKDGYIPIGVVGYEVLGTGSSEISVYRINLDGTDVHWHLRNHDSANFNGSIYVHILYMAT